MTAVIYISGKIGTDTTLVDVIRQFKSYEEPDSVHAVIDSVGGSKDEGDAIYDYLDGLKADLPVSTHAKKAYSIAAKIYAVGQERTIEDTDKALMIHFAWARAEGTAEDLEKVAAILRSYEDEFSGFYSELLDIDEETVRNLLDNETFLSGEEALELGFATELKVAAEAVAEYTINHTQKNSEMTTEKKKLGAKLLETMTAMAAYLGLEVNAALTLQDSDGTEIVFTDLEEDATPAVGDKATIDGAAVPDGSYIMPSMEEATVVFVDGAVSEIIPKETEESAEEIEARLAAEKAAEVLAEEIKEVFTYSVASTNTSFEEGETLMFEGWDGGDDYAASSGEFKLKDGRSIITDASGVIVKVKPADSEDQIIDADASFEALLTKVTEKVTAEVQAGLDVKLAEKDTEIEALKKQIGSKEFKAEEKGNEGSQEKNRSGVNVLLSKKKGQ